MNKKMVTLILVILVSFCFLTIVVADNATNSDDNTTDHNKTIDNDVSDKNKTDDKNDTPVKNKTDDKSKKHYILAKGKGNNIKFSDGFRGFILDYSKSPASSGDEFKRVSTSKASNSNALKLAIIECYKQNSTAKIAKIISSIVKTGSSNTKVGEAVKDSHEKIADHEAVKINNHTEAVFDFEVLKSVSGNESNYFAYKVSFKNINEEHQLNQTNNLTNMTNATNATNTTNITGITQPENNETNSTFLDGLLGYLLGDLYDYLTSLINALYDAWKPIIDSIINDFMMIVNAIEDLINFFENLMAEISSLIDAIGELLKMLESILVGLGGLLKLLDLLVGLIQQLINLIGAILNFVMGLISAIISLIQQLLGLLAGLIDFIVGLINQLIALVQAILDFLKSVGSFLVNIFENAAIIIISFVVIAVGAVIYNHFKGKA